MLESMIVSSVLHSTLFLYVGVNVSAIAFVPVIDHVCDCSTINPVCESSV
jgi:hypothetical protein